MPDDTRRDVRDRPHVSADGLELRHFADQHDMTPDEVRELIRKYGTNRDVLEKAAKTLRDRPNSADEVTRDARQQRTEMHLGNPKSRNG